MEKSTNSEVLPVQSTRAETLISIGTGSALFWASFFFLLVRNTFPDTAASEAATWLPIALRIALFTGFGGMAFAFSRSSEGVLGKRQSALSFALVVLFALDTLVAGALAMAGWSRPAAFDVAAWAVMGAGLAALFFMWLAHLSQLRDDEASLCVPLSAAAGALICLALNTMDVPANTLFLAACATASLAIHIILCRCAAEPGADRRRNVPSPEPEATKDSGEDEPGHAGESARADESGATLRGAGSKPPAAIPAGVTARAFDSHVRAITDDLEKDAIPFDTSRKNANLSWAFGIINIVYGIVFGLGAASLTQAPASGLAAAGAALAMIAGAGASCCFTLRTKGRVLQSSVLRMIFPVLVIALVPLSLFKDVAYLPCNLLLLGSYVFLVTTSIAFELRGAHERKASPLYFVGMSQTALAAGLAAGFALGLLPSATGALDYSVLSAISLGLVVMLAVFVAFTQGRMTADQSASDAEKLMQRINAERMLEEKMRESDHAGKARWRTSCESVAAAAGLSKRETEVFMLLAKGRGIDHIQRKLCISGHTVKTHTYNIYRKMGINSREELLDAIEEVKRSHRPETGE